MVYRDTPVRVWVATLLTSKPIRMMPLYYSQDCFMWFAAVGSTRSEISAAVLLSRVSTPARQQRLFRPSACAGMPCSVVARRNFFRTADKGDPLARRDAAAQAGAS